MMIPCTSSIYTHALLVPVPQEYDTPHPLHSQHEPGKYKRNTHFESQGTFPFCLNFRRDVSQTLQLHLHRWIRLFLAGFDPVWPKPACTYRTSILQHVAKTGRRLFAWSKGNQGAREGYLCARTNEKFLFYYPKLFLPVPLSFPGEEVKVIWLQKVSGKSGRKVNGTLLFVSFRWKIYGSNRPFGKVVLSFPDGMFWIHLIC